MLFLKRIYLLLFFILISSCASIDNNSSLKERNKSNVIKFYEAALNEKNFIKAREYLGDKYTQHNPNAEDGIEGLQKFIEILKNKYPNSKSEIKRIFVDGDYVITHVRNTGRTSGETAIIDIFLLDKEGKIIEHWDVTQKVGRSANNNGMF